MRLKRRSAQPECHLYLSRMGILLNKSWDTRARTSAVDGPHRSAFSGTASPDSVDPTSVTLIAWASPPLSSSPDIGKFGGIGKASAGRSRCCSVPFRSISRLRLRHFHSSTDVWYRSRATPFSSDMAFFFVLISFFWPDTVCWRFYIMQCTVYRWFSFFLTYACSSDSVMVFTSSVIRPSTASNCLSLSPVVRQPMRP